MIAKEQKNNIYCTIVQNRETSLKPPTIMTINNERVSV